MNIEQMNVVIRFDLAHRGMSQSASQVFPMVLKENICLVLEKVCNSRGYWYDNVVVETHKQGNKK